MDANSIMGGMIPLMPLRDKVCDTNYLPKSVVMDAPGDMIEENILHFIFWSKLAKPMLV